MSGNYETAVIENGYVVCRDCKLEPASNPATNEHGNKIVLTWQEVVNAGGTIWVSGEGQPHVDAAFSVTH